MGDNEVDMDRVRARFLNISFDNILNCAKNKILLKLEIIMHKYED